MHHLGREGYVEKLADHLLPAQAHEALPGAVDETDVAIGGDDVYERGRVLEKGSKKNAGSVELLCRSLALDGIANGSA